MKEQSPRELPLLLYVDIYSMAQSYRTLFNRNPLMSTIVDAGLRKYKHMTA